MSIGGRIRDERERLGFGQEAFAAIAGAARRTQVGWEQDRSLPNAAVLGAWAQEGADVGYIVTGMPSGSVDLPKFQLCEAALLGRLRKKHPATPESGVVRSIHAVKIYNEALREERAADGFMDALVRAVTKYIEWADDPSDPDQLERVLLHPAGATSGSSVVISGGRVAGRDMHKITIGRDKASSSDTKGPKKKK